MEGSVYKGPVYTVAISAMCEVWSKITLPEILLGRLTAKLKHKRTTNDDRITPTFRLLVSLICLVGSWLPCDQCPSCV
jgi:hypothetical protein